MSKKFFQVLALSVCATSAFMSPAVSQDLFEAEKKCRDCCKTVKKPFTKEGCIKGCAEARIGAENNKSICAAPQNEYACWVKGNNCTAPLGSKKQ